MGTDWEKQIEFVLDEFDFDKVQSVMEFLDWQWRNSSATSEVPSVGRLRRIARTLLREACQSDSGYCASGGLEARRISDPEGDFLSLSFVLEDMDSAFME